MLVIIGMKLNKFTSIAIHAINQLELVRASKDLRISVDSIRRDEGVRRSIRVWRS